MYVLPYVIKVFRIIIKERLTSYSMSNCYLQVNLAFVKMKNTKLAKLHQIGKILPAFEMRSYCICAFLYFSACFDKVSRNIFTASYLNTAFRVTVFHS